MSLNDNVGKHNDASREGNQEAKIGGIFDAPEKKDERTTLGEIRNAFTTCLLGSEAVFDKHVKNGEFPAKEAVMTLGTLQKLEGQGPSKEAKDQALDNIVKAAEGGEGLKNLGEALNKKRAEGEQQPQKVTDTSSLLDYKPETEEKKKGS